MYLHIIESDIPTARQRQQEQFAREQREREMTTQTQNPTEGLGRAAERRMDRAIKKQALATLIASHDLQFVYIRDINYAGVQFYGDVGEVNPKGGTVLAYRVPTTGGNVVEVATALCSPKDIFDKLEGKFMAANNFASGKRVKVKLTEDTRWGQQLLSMFEQ